MFAAAAPPPRNTNSQAFIMLPPEIFPPLLPAVRPKIIVKPGEDFSASPNPPTLRVDETGVGHQVMFYFYISIR